MEIKIQELLESTTSRFFFICDKDKTIYDKLDNLLNTCQDDQYAYIGTPEFVNYYYSHNPNSKWNIQGIFELGFPFFFFDYKNTPLSEKNILHEYLNSTPWYLYIFTTKKNPYINLGFNNVEVYAFKAIMDDSDNCIFDDNNEMKPYPESLNVDFYCVPVLKKNRFYKYDSQIEEFCKTNIIPENICYEKTSKNEFEFTQIPSEKFNLKYLQYLYRYKKSVIEDFGYPTEKEEISELSNVVQLIDLKNPDTMIKENDIIIDYFQLNGFSWKIEKSIYLATSSEKNNSLTQIIRSFTIDPYVLFTILNSQFVMDFCLRHFEAYFEDLVSIKTNKIKIFIPKNINTNYFKTKYQFSNENNSLINKLVNDKSDFYYTDSKQLIMNDFEELQICFNNKAYKAGIILAGSILEAFLIDWLSEIKKIDYFKESYIITDARTSKAREATLSDYIQEIKILKKPTWEDAAQKSISIKNHRNQVHARLHLSKNDISKETCTQMIEYLKYVIKTRWEN